MVGFSVERVMPVGRQPVGAYTVAVASMLDLLLGRAMAGGAQRLPIARVPEEALVTAMRPDVVDYTRADGSAFTGAARAPKMDRQEGVARAVPSGVIAAGSGTRSGGHQPSAWIS